MEERLIETVALGNGLTLKIFEASRPIAADRWHILLIARVEVPLDRIDFGNKASTCPDREELGRIIGNGVAFEQRQERNFVDQEEKEAVLKSLSTSLTASIAGYLSHPDFAARLALKEYIRRKNQHGMKSFQPADEIK